MLALIVDPYALMIELPLLSVLLSSLATYLHKLIPHHPIPDDPMIWDEANDNVSVTSEP